MSNGYLVAARSDVAAAHEISGGFGLDVIDAATIDDPDTAASALAAAANVGLLISSASAGDEKFVAVLRAIAQHLPRAQLILVDASARAAFPFLPEAWPTMAFDEARARSSELMRQRNGTLGSEPERAAPVAPPPAAEPEAAPEPELQTQAPQHDDAASARDEGEGDALADAKQEQAPTQSEATGTLADAEYQTTAEAEQAPIPAAPSHPPAHDLSAPNDGPSFGSVSGVPSAPPQPTPPPEPTQEEIDAAITTDRDLPTVDIPLKRPPEVAVPPSVPSPARQPSAPPMPKQGERERGITLEAARTGGASAAASVPADATAFAPKKLRRGTPELVQVTIHQSKDLKAVIKAARKTNPNTAPAPQGVYVGNIALGASIGVALETRGVVCDGAMQRQIWRGDPINFTFSVEPDDESKKAIFIARVFIDDAQIGVIGFTRPISGPAKKPAGAGDGARLKRYKRVFISYSSNDRDVVSAIATAYAAAGIPHFWDRASLKSGEIWHPRLRKEIDRADLFHLCWSKSAASSEWVEKEAEHALQRNMRSKGKMPNITVQMLDGPPWAPHPRQLDAINFDDFVRAAIVGYARGDGKS